MVRIVAGLPASAGSGFMTVRTEFSGIYRNMTRIRKALSNRREPLEEFAIDYMSRTIIKNRFDAQGIPRWKGLATLTVKYRKFKGQPILQQTGTLKNSATGGAFFDIRFFPTRSNAEEVEFGSDVPYAALHDQPRGTVGERNIPGRPWTNLTNENVDEGLNIMIKWVRKELTRIGIDLR